MLRGAGRYLETLNLTLQLFGTLYFVASLLSLAAAAIVLLPTVSYIIQKLPWSGKAIATEPALVFFPIHSTLLLIYIPLSLKSVHRFGWIRTAVILLPSCLILAVWVWFSIVFYHRYGLMELR